MARQRRPTSSRSSPRRTPRPTRSRSSPTCIMPLYAGPTGDTPEIDYALSLANPPDVQRRRQDGHDPDEARASSGPTGSRSTPTTCSSRSTCSRRRSRRAPPTGASTRPASSRRASPAPPPAASTRSSCTSTQPSTPASSSTTSCRTPTTSTRCRARRGTSPRPAARTSTGTNPANAKKIYDYLDKAGGAGRRRSPPTRCGRSSTVRSS